MQKHQAILLNIGLAIIIVALAAEYAPLETGLGPDTTVVPAETTAVDTLEEEPGGVCLVEVDWRFFSDLETIELINAMPDDTRVCFDQTGQLPEPPAGYMYHEDLSIGAYR